MSTSNKTETTTDANSSNDNKETTVENKAKNEAELKKKKELKFRELTDWLKKWGYETKDTTKENKTEGIEFQAQITPQIPYSSGLSTPLYLEFQQDLEDGFIIRTTFELDNQIKSDDLDVTFGELEHLIYPLDISMIKSFPLISLYKVVFLDDLRKQFLLDCITSLIHSMSLTNGKMNEKSREMIQLAQDNIAK
jgi:hypothetical protein